MTELQQYGSSAEPAVPQNSLDSWINAVGDIAKLADYISETDFVPDAMQGKPAAVAAAILTGREMGLEPMTALRSIHVIKGKPGLSAELMRAQVQAAGHQIRFVENTDSRCVLDGKRRGDTEWTRVSFTADQAKKADIKLGGYPEDKLIARATSRLCRRLFADVVAGLTSVDELEDVDSDTVAAQADATVAQQPPKRTAKRKTAATSKRITSKRQQQPTTIEPPPAADEASGPPLPGEDEEPASEDAEPTHTPGDDEQPVTQAQLTKLGALFTDAGVTDRDQRLKVSSQIVARELDSSKAMSKHEASTLIDTLEQLGQTGNLAETVADLVATQTGDTAAGEDDEQLRDDDPDLFAHQESNNE